jgi:hypothetical protein
MARHRSSGKVLVRPISENRPGQKIAWIGLCKRQVAGSKPASGSYKTAGGGLFELGPIHSMTASGGTFGEEEPGVCVPQIMESDAVREPGSIHRGAEVSAVGVGVAQRPPSGDVKT